MQKHNVSVCVRAHTGPASSNATKEKNTTGSVRRERHARVLFSAPPVDTRAHGAPPSVKLKPCTRAESDSFTEDT